MPQVHRRADGKLSRAEKLGDGSLRVPAILTRVGVFAYTRADGTKQREYRSAEQVMRADSLATLRSAAVTDLHPKRMVDLANRRALSVGHVTDNVRADEADDKLVAADLVITEPKMIGAIGRDDRAEISCGYDCDIDPTPGVSPDGERYDVAQINIRYNHAALLPRGAGRAGRSVALRLDADGHEIENETTPTPSAPAKENPMKKIHLDGVDYDPSSPEFAQAFDKYRARMDAEAAKVPGLQKELSTAEGRADAADLKVKGLEGDLAKANDPKRLDSLVDDREALKVSAAKVLGTEVKLDGLSEAEIRRKVVETSALKLDGRDDSYISAVFDSMVARADSNDDAPPAKTVADARPTPPSIRQDAVPTPAIPAWQQPLATSTRN